MTQIVLSQQDVEQVRMALQSGLETAAGARSRATSLHTAAQQIEATRSQLSKIRDVSRELPLLISIQQGVTGFFVAEAVLLELQSTVKRGRNRIVATNEWIDEGLCDKALYKSLWNIEKNAGVPHLLRLMVQAHKRGINNARTRRLFLSYLWNHPSLEFWAVKYREKLSEIFLHLYGKSYISRLLRAAREQLSLHGENGIRRFETATDEKVWDACIGRYNRRHNTDVVNAVLCYLFDGSIPWEVPEDAMYVYILQAIEARQDIFDKPLVPEEILTGLVSQPSHPQNREHWSTPDAQAQTLKRLRETSHVETASSAIRKTRREKERGISRDDDTRSEIISRVNDPIALLKTIYNSDSGGTEEEIGRLRQLAREARYKDFPYTYIGIIEDNSPSMRGHYTESKDTPRAISEFTRMVLAASASPDVVFAGNSGGGAGATDLTYKFLELMSSQTSRDIEAVFILSDGYENAPEGLLNQMIKTYRRVTGHEVPVFAVSPLGFAETNMRSRSLGDGIVSMVADHKSLPAQVTRHLLEADVRKWLELNVESLAGYLPWHATATR